MSKKEAARVRVRLWPNGSYAVSIADQDAQKYLLVEGDGRRAAHMIEVTEKRWNERTTSSVLYPTGIGTLTVNVSSHEPTEVRRVRQTTFPNGTRRRDDIVLNGSALLRSSLWDFPDGSSAVSEDLGHHHTVVFQGADGVVTQTRHSETSLLPNGRSVTRTQILDGGGQKIGLIIATRTGNTINTRTLDSQNNDTGPQTSTHSVSSPAGASTTTVTTNPTMGTTTWTTTTSSSELTSVITMTSDGQGNTSTDTKFTYASSEGEGTSITSTITDTQDNQGNTTHSDSTTYNNADGSSSTIGSTSVDGVLTSQTSKADDGAGNVSTTTVTFNSDGTYTITTESKDSDGNGSIDSQTYDQNGNSTDSSMGNISGSGTADNSGSGTGDTSSSGTADNSGSGGDNPGSGSGEGSMPSDDGTDESPHRYQGSSDGGLDNLLNGLSQGDDSQQFTNSMSSQLQGSVEGGGTGWGDSSSNEGPASPILDQSIDIRQIASATDDWGNINNPRALVGIASFFVGKERIGAANQFGS